MTDTTSWFHDQGQLQYTEPLRYFYIGSDNYSDRVKRWPTISTDYNRVRPGRVNITLNNHDQVLNSFLTDKTNLTKQVLLKFGYVDVTSPSGIVGIAIAGIALVGGGDGELATLYDGSIDTIIYNKDNTISLSLQDRMKKLSDRYLGTEDAPVDFPDTTLPSEIFWTACTCYGGLSGIESSSNPDIDYDAYLSWHTRIQNDSLFTGAQFKNVRAIEVLSKIARQTDSVITVENNRLYVNRWSYAESIYQDFDLDISQLSISMATTDLINRQIMAGGYDVTSKQYSIEVSVEKTSSVNSYGLVEKSERDESLWFVSSSSCVNFAQRKIVFNAEPAERINIHTYLHGLTRRLGDTITTTNSVYNHSGYVSRITNKSVNMADGSVTLKSSPSIILAGFVLDTDTLDVTDKFLT